MCVFVRIRHVDSMYIWMYNCLLDCLFHNHLATLHIGLLFNPLFFSLSLLSLSRYISLVYVGWLMVGMRGEMVVAGWEPSEISRMRTVINGRARLVTEQGFFFLMFGSFLLAQHGLNYSPWIIKLFRFHYLWLARRHSLLYVVFHVL